MRSLILAISLFAGSLAPLGSAPAAAQVANSAASDPLPADFRGKVQYFGNHSGEVVATVPGTRQIFVIDVESVQTSCGWGVPFMAYQAERPTLKKAHTQADPEQWEAKMAGRTSSIDGLPTRATNRYIAGTPLD